MQAPESPKMKGIPKGYPPRDNSKGGPLGKENRHRRTSSCVGRIGAVKPLAERQNNSLSLSDRNCVSAVPSDSSLGSGRGNKKESGLDGSKKGSGTWKSWLDQLKNQGKVTNPQPFRLRTEERGQMKEQQFMKKVQEQMEEEEKLRIPIAHRLPLTTDQPQVLPKPPVKEQTKPSNVKLHTESRAAERAEFDNFVDEKISYIERQKLEEERIKKQREEEEVKRLRAQMIPLAQDLPFFDQPFVPKKSSKPLTVPIEPKLKTHRRTRSLA